jgi:hypothetical protein
MDKSFTKKELINTILNCKPTEEQKKELMEAYEVLLLKLKINDKKKILSDNNYEINHLNKNATTKVLKELDNEYQLKCGHQKKISRVIHKMEENIKKNEKIIQDLEEEYNIQKEKNKKIKEKLEESQKNMKESEDEKNVLMKALGANNPIEIDIFDCDNTVTDILLCSDGLTNMLDVENIERVILSDYTVEDKVNRLIKKANTRGGTDNISVAYLERIERNKEGE